MSSQSNESNDIDSIIEKLGCSFEVSQATQMFNPRYALYKNKPNVVDSEQRRALFLNNQKKKRRENLAKIRHLTDINCEEDDDDDDHENMDSDDVKSQSSQSEEKIKKFNPYKDQLMLSEWLTEKPSDFENNWYLVVCPAGKRCLVISSAGQTRVYARSGHFMRAFPSFLPGGNRRDNCVHKKGAILDCIFSERDKTFFILDIMLWNQSQFYDSCTELRFYWLKTKIVEEYSNLSSVDRLNPFKFVLLDHFNCDNQSIKSAIQTYSHKPKIDGLLFFHKKCHYIPEVSPLVCWLKLSMLKDVLGIEIELPNQMDLGVED